MGKSIVVTRTCRAPLPSVVDQVHSDAAGLIRMATDAAAGITNDIVVSLDNHWAWFDVHERVRVEVGEMDRGMGEARMDLRWRAETGKRLLPGVEGALTLAALSDRYSEVGFAGRFVPPPGLMGSASGVVIGRRVATAAMGHLLDRLVEHIEQAEPDEATD